MTRRVNAQSCGWLVRLSDFDKGGFLVGMLCGDVRTRTPPLGPRSLLLLVKLHSAHLGLSVAIRLPRGLDV